VLNVTHRVLETEDLNSLGSVKYPLLLSLLVLPHPDLAAWRDATALDPHLVALTDYLEAQRNNATPKLSREYWWTYHDSITKASRTRYMKKRTTSLTSSKPIVQKYTNAAEAKVYGLCERLKVTNQLAYSEQTPRKARAK
jgi:hypothetical protein